MSDEKNNNDTDFEEKLAEIVNKKSRNPTNNNIYERFISRVKNDGDERSASPELTGTVFDFSNQSTSIHSQPPNNNTLSENNDLDDDTFNFNIDDEINPTNQVTAPSVTVRSDTDETVHELDNDRANLQDLPVQPITKEVKSSKDIQASNKKTLIIGMVLGSLLIGMVVAILIFTGILSPAIKEETLNTAETTTNNEVDKDAETAATGNSAVVDNAQTPTTIDNPLAGDADAVNPPASALPEGNSTDDTQAATANEPVPAATEALDTEPAITYEDFREESQNTLYREVED